MKLKTLILALVAVFFINVFFTEAKAQKPAAKNYIQGISGDLVSLAFGELRVTYEQQIFPINSFTGFLSYWSFGEWSAIGIGGSYRFYLLNDIARPIEGFSFGPLVKFNSWSITSKTSNRDGGASLGIGAVAAYKWVFNDALLLEPIIHLNFNLLDVERLDYRPIIIGINIGYAW